MLLLVLCLAGPVAVVFAARRLADHPAVLVARDVLIAGFLVYRWLFRLTRSIVRFVAGEVRSWAPSR
jgi:hypothetical protein